MQEGEKDFIKHIEAPSFQEIQEGNSIRIVCKLGEKEIGAVSLNLLEQNLYDVGGMFVDPSKRGKGISSGLVKLVNSFLERNHSIGKLVNTIQGEASRVYENNGWKKGDYKSQGAYGAYEYTYDGTHEKNTETIEGGEK